MLSISKALQNREEAYRLQVLPAGGCRNLPWHRALREEVAVCVAEGLDPGAGQVLQGARVRKE